MGTAKKSRSWHGNLKDTDPEGENENASAPISDTISDSNCTSRKHSVVISESATPLSGADDEMSDEESVKAQNRRKSSVLLVPEKKSRHSRRHEGGNCSNSFLFFKHEKPDPEALDAAAKFVAEVLYLAQMEAVQRQSQSVKENLPKINLSEEQSKTKKIQRRVVKLFRRFLRVCGCYHVIPSP
ncbi:uncharacterized protein LOC136037707 [Artemia franciscana]|uniref:uncharacterized protein LOC136037707 n=1 Tax=Artemia franciscana TaxID=6661 RepID=UPI0032D9B25D